MNEELQPEELAGLEAEANYALTPEGHNADYVYRKEGVNFILIHPNFLLRLIKESKQLQAIKEKGIRAIPTRELKDLKEQIRKAQNPLVRFSDFETMKEEARKAKNLGLYYTEVFLSKYID